MSAVSVVSLINTNWPGMTVLRLLRIFRVFRIFARLQSFRMIADSFSAALLPVVNAFSVVFLITSVYAILAVNSFQALPDEFSDFSTAVVR